MDGLMASLSRHNSPYFRVTARNQWEAPLETTRHCKLVLPAEFVQQHHDKLNLQEPAILRRVLAIDHLSLATPMTVFLDSTKRTELHPISQTYFGSGWKDFATKNEVAVGDSLIFQLLQTSSSTDFVVYIFRAPARPISRSHQPTDRPSDSDFHRRKYVPIKSRAAGCSSDQLYEANAKKRKVDGSGNARAVGTLTENPYHIKLRDSEPEQEGVQISSALTRQDREPHTPQTTPCDSKNSHFRKDLQQPIAPLPFFIQSLQRLHVQDYAGNTCGARFEVPLSFVKKHNVSLQRLVKLQMQGMGKVSPIRAFTRTYNVFQGDAERSELPPLSLGWGDFVRDHGLYDGQNLVFTLAADSHFIIGEVQAVLF